MSYLISQYLWWLVLALILGVVVGWMTCRDQPRQWGWLPLGIVIAVLALLLTLFRFINGIAALWVETGLLFFTVYLAGCCLGCWAKPYLMRFVEPPMPRWVTIAGSPSDVPVEVPAPFMREWVQVPQQPAGALAAMPATMPRVEGEDLIAGARPMGLLAPRGGTADDLKLIKGIGRQNEGRLHGLGIWHFDQIAAWTKENVDWVGAYLAFPGRIEREAWVSQAQELASGGETDFAKRVKRGEISTSKDDGSLGQGNVAQMGEDGFEGTRPANTLAGPRGGKADDLKLINGVGRSIEQKLHALGIWHFDQIAAMGEEELRFISHSPASRAAPCARTGRAKPRRWRRAARPSTPRPSRRARSRPASTIRRRAEPRLPRRKATAAGTSARPFCA